MGISWVNSPDILSHLRDDSIINHPAEPIQERKSANSFGGLTKE
jgi:hypothetical protein